ncbi:MAG: hypothetical protein J6K89_03365 [Oscillospiraceae bacterium]|nr:hypothetical protein [Oscillospiraceae bacterium]
MRKDYRKPQLLVERFALTQQLTGCVLQIAYNNSQCVIKDPDASDDMKDQAVAGVFVSECDEFIKGQDYDDGICYHTSVNLAFTS